MEYLLGISFESTQWSDNGVYKEITFELELSWVYAAAAQNPAHLGPLRRRTGFRLYLFK